jgi:hypothetical protein
MASSRLLIRRIAMRMISCFVAAVLVVGASTSAQAVTAGQAGAASAKRLGYSGVQATCFSGVFERYASQNANGRWVIAGGKRRSGPGAAFRSDLQSQCGISR